MLGLGLGLGFGCRKKQRPVVVANPSQSSSSPTRFTCSLLYYTAEHFLASLHLWPSAFNNCTLRARVLQALGLLFNMPKSKRNKLGEKQTVSWWCVSWLLWSWSSFCTLFFRAHSISGEMLRVRSLCLPPFGAFCFVLFCYYFAVGERRRQMVGESVCCVAGPITWLTLKIVAKKFLSETHIFPSCCYFARLGRYLELHLRGILALNLRPCNFLWTIRIWLLLESL